MRQWTASMARSGEADPSTHAVSVHESTMPALLAEAGEWATVLPQLVAEESKPVRQRCRPR